MTLKVYSWQALPQLHLSTVLDEHIILEYLCNSLVMVIISKYGKIQEYFPFVLCTLFLIKVHHHKIAAENAAARSSSF